MITNVTLVFILFFTLAIAFFGLYLGKVKGSGDKKWYLILYLLIAGILIGVTHRYGFFEFTELPLWFFIVGQVWLLLVGILHVWLFDKLIKLENSSLSRIIFTMAVFFFGYGLFIMTFKVYFRIPFPWLYFIPGLFFIAPTFIYIAFDYFTRIPGKIFKVWEFPSPGALPDPKDSEMADLIIINIEIRKRLDDSRTVFKAKAPKHMTLGKLFYFFIGDYNSRNPNNPVDINETETRRFSWSFYQTPNIFIGRKHLDPDLTISENKIKENSSILCERIISE
jgi:hypothetical protein